MGIQASGTFTLTKNKDFVSLRSVKADRHYVVLFVHSDIALDIINMESKNGAMTTALLTGNEPDSIVSNALAVPNDKGGNAAAPNGGFAISAVTGAFAFLPWTKASRETLSTCTFIVDDSSYAFSFFKKSSSSKVLIIRLHPNNDSSTLLARNSFWELFSLCRRKGRNSEALGTKMELYRFSWQHTADGRNPAPPGMYKTLKPCK